jgi:hypothetical protein
MRRAGLAFVAALVSACSPPQQRTDANAAQIPIAAGCSAQASRDWSAVGSQYYIIEAEAEGATCADAVATMRIRSRDGVVLFTRDYPVREVPLAFNPNSDQTGLRGDLEAWTQNTAEPATADTLPRWPAGARRPPGFEPAVPRNRYEDARGAQGPLFCFPDGGESNACVAMAGDSATLLGSLTPERP